jgi:hypothetical protein
LDGLVGAAVGRGGQVHAVPVDGGRLGQVVGDLHDHLVAVGGANGRSEVAAVGAPALGGLAGQELAGALLEAQVEDLAAGAVLARFQQRWDLELVGEAELADVADVGLGPQPGRQPGQPQDPSQT